MPRERLLVVAVVFIVIGVVWTAIQGSWVAAAIVGAVALALAYALYRLQPPA